MNNIEPYSPDWFKIRQGNFTGSEAWKLMTEPRSKSETISATSETYIIEKVWERLSGQTKGGIDNFATEWGNDNEPLAVKWYEKLTEVKTSDPFLVAKPDFEGFTGTPDRLVGEEGLIEVKCPWNGANHLKNCFIISDEILKSEHKEYYWQMQSYMFLTDRKWCDFVSFDPRIDSDLGLFIYRLNRNEEDIEKLQNKVIEARELFNEYLKLFKPKQ